MADSISALSASVQGFSRPRATKVFFGLVRMEVLRRGVQACTMVACFISSIAMAQSISAARPIPQPDLVQACQGCHGVGGNSTVSSTPRLNGQQAGYIADRLKKLSDETRTNAHARIGMFKDFSAGNDAARTSVARFFAGQQPTNPKPGARATEGKRIYEKGSAEDNVVACSLCHGPEGNGHDTTPRIAGQHADYLKAQLQLFNLKFREHILMNRNAKTMSESTMDALASYLGSD